MKETHRKKETSKESITKLDLRNYRFPTDFSFFIGIFIFVSLWLAERKENKSIGKETQIDRFVSRRMIETENMFNRKPNTKIENCSTAAVAFREAQANKAFLFKFSLIVDPKLSNKTWAKKKKWSRQKNGLRRRNEEKKWKRQVSDGRRLIVCQLESEFSCSFIYSLTFSQ